MVVNWPQSEILIQSSIQPSIGIYMVWCK